MVHAARHLENNYNEEGRDSIEQRMIERKNKNQNMKKKLLLRRNNVKRRLLAPIPNVKEEEEHNKKFPRN